MCRHRYTMFAGKMLNIADAECSPSTRDMPPSRRNLSLLPPPKLHSMNLLRQGGTDRIKDPRTPFSRVDVQ